jgi:periplasmic protein CpxP/Spy
MCENGGIARMAHLSKQWRQLNRVHTGQSKKVSLMKACRLTVLLVALAGVAAAAEGKIDSARVADRVARLQQQLKLTADQTERVRGILLAAEELKGIDRDRFKEDQEARAEAGRERTNRVNDQIRELLTDEQRPIFDALRQQDQKEPWRRIAQDMEERLNLSAEQTVRVNGLLAAQAAQMAQMRSDGAGQRNSRGEAQTRTQAVRKLRDDTDKKIEAILTDEQKKEFKKYKKERQDETKRDFGGQDNGPRGF